MNSGKPGRRDFTFAHWTACVSDCPHELYSRLTTTRNIAIFMKHHVWAVWDFDVVGQGLQRQLTGIDLPWRPVGDPGDCFLINDIVVGEGE
jgi:hypothetical protein